MKRFRWVTIAMAGLCLLAVLAPSAAVAARYGAARAALGGTTTYGTVASVTGTCMPAQTQRRGKPQTTCTFTITMAQATITVTALTTTVWIPYSIPAVVAGFVAGDAVVVKASGSPLVAQKVTFNTTPFPVPPAKLKQTTGRYVSATATQLVLSHGAKDLTFTITPNTRYREKGKSVTAPTYATGEALRVFSQLYTDGNQWATAVWITTPKKSKK